MDKHTFVFNINNLLEEVDKRTSYLGKMRTSNETPNALDRLRLSSGEDFLSTEFLEDAAANTYDWIKGFGRNIAHAYRVLSEIPTSLQENVGVRIQYAGETYAHKCVIGVSEIEEMNISGNKVILYMPAITLLKGEANNVCYAVTVYYTTGVSDTPIKDHLQFRKDVCFASNSSDVGTISFTFPQPTLPYGEVELQEIERVEIEITQIDSSTCISKGAYIEMRYLSGRITYGILSSDYRSNQNIVPDFEEEYDIDINHSITMQVQLLDWQDRNMLPIVERNLKEALINYIIYRWFEMVNPKESEYYLNKWEDKSRIAQMGLNTERRILQRKLINL